MENQNQIEHENIPRPRSVSPAPTATRIGSDRDTVEKPQWLQLITLLVSFVERELIPLVKDYISKNPGEFAFFCFLFGQIFIMFLICVLLMKISRSRSSHESKPTTIRDMPDQIMNQIFHHLDSFELKSCRLVCPAWNWQIMASDMLLPVVKIDDSDSSLLYYVQNLTPLRAIHLYKLDVHHYEEFLGSAYHQIEYLRISSHCFLHQNFIKRILMQLTNLTCLRIEEGVLSRTYFQDGFGRSLKAPVLHKLQEFQIYPNGPTSTFSNSGSLKYENVDFLLRNISSKRVKILHLSLTPFDINTTSVGPGPLEIDQVELMKFIARQTEIKSIQLHHCGGNLQADFIHKLLAKTEDTLHQLSLQPITQGEILNGASFQHTKLTQLRLIGGGGSGGGGMGISGTGTAPCEFNNLYLLQKSLTHLHLENFILSREDFIIISQLMTELKSLYIDLGTAAMTTGFHLGRLFRLTPIIQGFLNSNSNHHLQELYLAPFLFEDCDSDLQNGLLTYGFPLVNQQPLHPDSPHHGPDLNNNNKTTKTKYPYCVRTRRKVGRLQLVTY